MKTRKKVVEEIFNIFENFYKDRWNKNFLPTNRIDSNFKKKLFYTMWINGLQGCTHREINVTILHYKNIALNHPRLLPPSVQEFFNYCKRSTIKPKRNYPYDTILNTPVPNKLYSKPSLYTD